MSGNGEQIDLNSNADLRAREFKAHGVNLSNPVTDSLNEQIHVEIRSSEPGIVVADVEFLEGKSIDYDKGTEIDSAASDVEMEPVEVKCKGETIDAEEGGVSDDMNGDHSIIEVQEVAQNEDVKVAQNEDVKVAQNEQIALESAGEKFDQGVKEDSESHSLLHHEGCVDVHTNISPEGSFHYKDVDDSSSVHDNLGSGYPKNVEDVTQLADNLDQKAENLMGSNELPPVLAMVTDIRTLPPANCSENQSGNVDGGQTIENPVTGSHILKRGDLTDLDKPNLFDVLVKADPYVKIDEVDVNEDSVVGFNVSELVWSRVPSHPWWPGQIINPATSTKKAMKYFKPGRYLVAFFGDNTFAWKEAAMIKPFQKHFPELQKQNDLESFHRAIDCALEEFSRRVELSLACTCLSEELYSQLQTQTLTNGGIRKKLSKIVGGDSSLTASSFDPMKLIDIVKEVAMSPCGEADKLELVRARAQLLSFNRWKGYYELPKYDKHNVVFNYQISDVKNDDLGLIQKKNDDQDLIQNKNDDQSASMLNMVIDIKHDELATSGIENSKTQDSSGGKRKCKPKDLKDSSKKCKSLSNSTPKKPRRSWKKKQESKENAGNELNLLVSNTKDQAVCCNNTAVSIPITHVESGKKTTQSFKVGDRIRKVACKLNESNPILKLDDGLSQAAVSKTKRGRKRKNFETFAHLTHPKVQETLELVSDVKTENKSTKARKRRNISAPTEALDSEFLKDTYRTDRLVQGVPEDQVTFENQNETIEGQVHTPSETVIPIKRVEPESENCVEDPYPTAHIERVESELENCAKDPYPAARIERVESELENCVEDPHPTTARIERVESELENSMKDTDPAASIECVESELENCVEDPYPTALILTFTDFDSIPSVTNLNDIFGKYGPLYESKTEVMKKSRGAKVVFKRTLDAETAFSITGKDGIFGSALVSYRLKFLSPTKVVSRGTRKCRKEAKS